MVPAFVQAGARAVVLIARSEAQLESCAADVRKLNPAVHVTPIAADISSADGVAKVFDTVAELYGFADILINNAAVYNERGTLRDVDAAEWWAHFVSVSCHRPESLLPARRPAGGY